MFACESKQSDTELYDAEKILSLIALSKVEWN